MFSNSTLYLSPIFNIIYTMHVKFKYSQNLKSVYLSVNAISISEYRGLCDAGTI